MTNRVMRSFVSLLLMLAIATLSGCSWQQFANSMDSSADYAFVNGFVYTMDEKNPKAQAVAVKGNKIIYVGNEAGLSKVLDDKSEVIDLAGKMVLPGFVEGHIHAISGGLVMNGVDLQTDDPEEILARIRKYVKESDEEVILGYGIRLHLWDNGFPTAAMLDEIESERPIYLWAIDAHSAWVNSKALEIAGIDKNTPDTVPGYSYFVRDEEKKPLGWVVELPAQMQVLTSIIKFDNAFIKKGLAEWLPRFSEAGITTVHDMGIQGIPQEDGYEIFMEIEKEGKLPVRLQGVYYWNDPKVDPVPLLQDMRKRYSTELVKARDLKVNLDGGDFSRNALMLEPYEDKPDVVAKPIIPYDVLNDVVTRADAAGINSACHCFGDLAVRKFLDAVEVATKENPDRDRRYVVSHGVLVHPDDYPRFKELNTTYDSSGAWMVLDPRRETISMERLGAKRVNMEFPMKAVADAGGNISLGTDWPASAYLSTFNPLVAIQGAVTRQPQGKPDHPILGGEKARVPLEMALKAQTLGSAYGMNVDDTVGSLQVGKLADLVVLEKNLFDISPYEIGDVKVIYTMMNGKFVYRVNSD